MFTYRPIGYGAGEERSLLQTGLFEKYRVDREPVTAFVSRLEHPTIYNYPHLRLCGGSYELGYLQHRDEHAAETGIYAACGNVQEDDQCMHAYIGGLKHAYQSIQAFAKHPGWKNYLWTAMKDRSSRLVVFPTRSYRAVQAKWSAEWNEHTNLGEVRSAMEKVLTTERKIAISPGIVSSEIDQILEGDIPIFLVNCCTGTIVDGRSKTVGRTPASPLDQVISFIENDLNSAYIDRQLRIVENQVRKFRIGSTTGTE